MKRIEFERREAEARRRRQLEEEEQRRKSKELEEQRRRELAKRQREDRTYSDFYLLPSKYLSGAYTLILFLEID